jgi:hypothetical protein
MGVGSKAKKRRVPLKEINAEQIDDFLELDAPLPNELEANLRSTNEMPSPEVTDISDELI